TSCRSPHPHIPLNTQSSSSARCFVERLRSFASAFVFERSSYPQDVVHIHDHVFQGFAGVLGLGVSCAAIFSRGPRGGYLGRCHAHPTLGSTRALRLQVHCFIRPHGAFLNPSSDNRAWPGRGGRAGAPDQISRSPPTYVRCGGTISVEFVEPRGPAPVARVHSAAVSFFRGVASVCAAGICFKGALTAPPTPHVH
ncbi:hypothetical protein TSOC_006200, partial [Tetrabaena socialis]